MLNVGLAQNQVEVRIVIQFLVAVLMLTQSSGTLATQSKSIAATDLRAGKHTNSPSSNTAPPRQAEQSPAGASKTKNRAGDPQSNDPLQTLTLGVSVYRLALKPTAQSAGKALDMCKRAFATYQKEDNKMGMAASMFGSGCCYYYLGRIDESLNASLEALRYCDEAGPDLFSLRPGIQGTIGAAYASLGEFGKALDFLNKAQVGLQRATFPSIIATAIDTLDKLGVIVSGLPELKELPKMWQMMHSGFTAFVLKNLGNVSIELGKKREAIGYLEQALPLYRKANAWADQFEILAGLCTAAYSIGQTKKANEYAGETLKLTTANPSLEAEPTAHMALAATYVLSGDLKRGLAEYDRALDLLHQQGDPTAEAMVLNNLGLINLNRGDLTAALDHFSRSLKLSEEAKNERSEAYAISNIGGVYFHRGEPVSALQHYERALALARRTKDRRLEAAVLSSIAAVSPPTNSPEYTVKVLKEAAEVFKEMGEPAFESESIISLADAYTALGRPQSGLDALRSALESRREADDPRREGYILREMAHIHFSMGDRGEALRRYAEGLSRLEAAGDEIGQVDIYAGMASIHLSNGEYDKARELYLRGLGLARKAGMSQREEIILTMLGSLHERQGNLAQAEAFYDQEIAVGESVRSSARIEELKSDVAAVSSGLIAPAILLKFKLGKLSEAFELSEWARARTFLDQINNVRLDISNGADPQLVDQEQSLRLEIHALDEKLRKERLSNASSAAAKALAANLKEREEAYAALLIRLKASNPHYAQLRSYSPVALKEIQRLIGSKTTLVSYFVTTDKTLAFVITSSSFQAVEIPVKEADLRGAINWFRSFPNLRDAEPQSLTQLSSWLIAPIKEFIKTSDVVIVPHGVLHYAPFAALTGGRVYFGDEHPIHYLPSASILPSLRRRTQPTGHVVLAVSQSRADGLPALRHADEEAASVAKLYHTQPLTTGRATRAELLKRASACNILHIAAHAQLKATSPLFSSILLSAEKDESPALEVREVYGMDLNQTNLVVLSACETQLGSQSRGDDIVGLNRAFMYAGARSVIASLWTVDDEATSLLMQAFYTKLKQGMTKARALQAAQSETRKKYPHPYYWAGFVLTGDPGQPK